VRLRFTVFGIGRNSSEAVTIVFVAVNVEELARRAGSIVQEVSRTRRHTLITDNGQPVAVIVPVGEESTALDELTERFTRRGSFAELRPVGSSAVDELLAERREEAAREDGA
jgi:prevent-host-death family protein